MVRCRTCGGTYEPILPDGTQYFHACSPLSVAEIRQGLQDNTIQLSRIDRLRLRTARDADRTNPPAEGEPSQEERALQLMVVERPNKRDENIRTGLDARDKGSRIKAEGAGVEDVVDE